MPRKRDLSVPEAAGAGREYAIEQPSLLWPAYDVVLDERRLASVTRRGWRRFRYEDSEVQLDGRFDGARLAFSNGDAALVAEAAGPRRARLLSMTLEPVDREHPQARLLASDGSPVAVFGAMRGAGLSGRARVWVRDDLAGDERRTARALALALVVQRFAPASFR